MNVDQIFSWILSHAKNYPGKHQESQPRTLSSFKPLEPKSQFHVIFKSLSEYIKENLASGKSVNLKGFGAFSFEIESSLVEPAIFSTIDFKKQLDEQRAERKHVHKIRPCFVVDSKMKYLLTRYPNKEEISHSKSQNSVYQQGFGMVFCNAGPIAASCYLGKEVVTSAISAFIEAVSNLTQLGYNIDVDFGFAKVKINNKNLSYSYQQTFSSGLNNTAFESKIKKAEVSTSSHWQTTSQDKWANSNLSSLYKQPDADKAQVLSEKTLALKIMSLDMNSAEKTGISQIKHNGPKLDARKSGF
jgi:nucleoid DNA-binding protein